MRNILILLLVTSLSFSFAQNKTIELDYTVDYIIPNNKKQTIDTVSIGFNKDGKYLWTNADTITKDLTKNGFFSKASQTEDFDINLIYETTNNKVMIIMNFGESDLFANMDMSTLMAGANTTQFNEDIDIQTSPLNIKEKVLGKKRSVFSFTADGDQSGDLKVFIDESLQCDNNEYISQIINLLITSTNSQGNISANIPDGLILKVSANGETLIEAINVSIDKKTLELNYNFQIKE